MAFLSSDIPKYLFCFLFGISLTGALFFKVESDHIQLYKLLYTVDYLRIQEIELIWLDVETQDTESSNNNSELSIEDMNQLLFNVYKQQETKLKIFYKKNYSVYQSSLLSNPLYMLGLCERFNAIDKPTIRNIDQVLHHPLALRRCQNIVKQLLENGITMTPMLLAPLNIIPTISSSQQPGIRPGQAPIQRSSINNPCFTLTKQEFLSMIPHLLEESLSNDLFDFLENNDNNNRHCGGGDVSKENQRLHFSYMNDDETNHSMKNINSMDHPGELLTSTITTTSSLNSTSGASHNSNDFNFFVSDSNNKASYYQNNNHNDRDTFDSTTSSTYTNSSTTTTTNNNNNNNNNDHYQQQYPSGSGIGQGVSSSTYKKVNKKSRQSDVFDYMMKI